MTSRRSFLKGIGFIVAAPAIVRSESLMQIFVPKREIIVDPLHWGNMSWRPELVMVMPTERARSRIEILNSDAIRERMRNQPKLDLARGGQMGWVPMGNFPLLDVVNIAIG